ncbi:MAG: aspartyl protease [bacterium]|nr:aspartyl protease [bacterium]
MGRVMTMIKVENLGDILLAERNQLDLKEIRSIELPALVDTGATMLCLPQKEISALGLSYLGDRGAEPAWRATTATGPVGRKVFQGARLTIMERTCTIDVMEIPEKGIPALVGYIALENLDFQVDPKKQALIPNPEHGGKMVMDLFMNCGMRIAE